VNRKFNEGVCRLPFAGEPLKPPNQFLRRDHEAVEHGPSPRVPKAKPPGWNEPPGFPPGKAQTPRANSFLGPRFSLVINGRKRGPKGLKGFLFARNSCAGKCESPNQWARPTASVWCPGFPRCRKFPAGGKCLNPVSGPVTSAQAGNVLKAGLSRANPPGKVGLKPTSRRTWTFQSGLRGRWTYPRGNRNPWCCSPRFRISASVLFQKIAFAFGIPSNLYGFYPYTTNSIFLSQTLVIQF